VNGSPGAAFWADTAADVVTRLGGDLEGLSDAEVARRRAVHGPNRLTASRHTGPLHQLVRQFTQPIALILIGATVLALLLGDTVDALIILVIILLSGLLGFWQEHGASVTVARLLARVQIHVEVRRGGAVVSVRPEDVVPGDVLIFNAGDIVPCDCRLLSEESLQVDESALTGESYPRHKHPDPAAADAPLAERHSALFQGSHVVSGKGEALAVVTGPHTELGIMAQTLLTAPARTSFEEGTTRFGLLLARVTAILTAAILVLNITLGRPFIDAVLFSLALAIGVTPQMLPAIVAVSLSTGARRLARAEVIVRRLDAIEDLGSMDVLFTDKTGTLTEGRITLDAALDSDGRPSELVAERAAANAGLQTGFTNPLDEAVLAACRPGTQWRALDEIPFDFERKRLSVLVHGPEGRLLITKGAYTSVLKVCSRVATPQGERAVGDVRAALDQRFERLSAEGYRVLAVAQRALPDREELTGADEADLTFLGFLAFGDPVKRDLGETVGGLERQGIRLCILTGDNLLTARHVATAIGTRSPKVLIGSDVDALDDAELARAASTAHAFAELTPTHKERIIDAVRAGGSVVGYLGDGINDAGPLHRADVGISVDSAVDVAKSAASMVLLDKNLAVVVEGVRLGRRTFVNTLKYVYTTISANFGNTASMAAASAFLPFLPMLPRQILLLNFLSDLPSVTIAGDRVDEEEVEHPRRWDVHAVRNFMITFGLLSSSFDLVAFAVLLQVFHADATVFRTGWFIESALTELAVLFVLRTRRVVLRSMPARTLLVTSILVALVTIALPFVPDLAGPMGLAPPRWQVLAALIAITCTYVVAAEVTKRFFYRAASSGAFRQGRVVVAGPERAVRRLAHEHGHRHPPAGVRVLRRERSP
jgi:Mg2+-importing ATPase